MIKSCRTFLIVSILVVTTAVCVLPSAYGQCSDTLFENGYRAVNKIRQDGENDNYAVLDDWTGDGRADFWNFRRNQTTGLQDIVIYPALPTGFWNWDAPIVYTTNFGPGATTALFRNFSFLLEDYNSDGLVDMSFESSGNGGTKFTSIHLNNGTAMVPAPQTAWPTDTDTLMGPVGFFDLTGDGILDRAYLLIETSNNQRALYYSQGNPNGTFGPPVLILNATPQNELTNYPIIGGDFNGDGKIDIAYAYEDGAVERIRVLRNLGNGTFMLGDPMTTDVFSLTYNFGANTITDFNNDGRTDFLARRDGSFVIFYGQADSTFVASANIPLANPSGSTSTPNDFNGDGRRDLIFTSNVDYEIHLNNSDGTYTRRQYPVRLGRSGSAYLEFGDFNADGKADMFDESFAGRFFNGFREEIALVKTNVCESSPVLPKAANFDGDANPEIVSWNGTNGQWKYGDAFFTGSESILVTTFTWGLGSLGDVPAPGDFDGDGKTDHTVYRNSEGNWYTLFSGDGSWLVFRFGLPGDIPIPNDYNGGGRTDFAVFRPSDGNWYIWYTETQQFAVVHWGAIGDRPVPADYDGDQKTDIAVFRPSEGNWYYIRSSDSAFGIFHWGSNGDIPLPADYDGDRKADLTVYRAGLWYILRSTNGAFAPVYWGTTGDVPIPVMQQLDVSFPVVNRPGDSRWYGYPFGYKLTLPGTPVYFGLPNN